MKITFKRNEFYLLLLLSVQINFCIGQNKTLPNDSAANHNIVSTKLKYNTTFAANVVSEMGKPINSIFQDMNNCYWFASNAN